MSTPTLGQRAAAALKEAKAKGPVSWEEVAAVIDRCATPAPAAAPTAAKVTVEAIYAVYPRKKQPRTAKVAIERAAKRLAGQADPLAYLLERTSLYATAVAAWPAEERQYVPYPASWFNADSFDEDPKEWERGAAPKMQPRNYGQI